jgi:amino acid adenylation domain-containing protein
MPNTQLKKILFEFNNTTRNYAQDKCIHQLFEEQAERTPNAIAVVFEQQELTYQSLNQKANKIAHYLQTLGVKPEVLVGLCVERSLEMVIGILGILKAGGAYVPIDPNYPTERIAYMVSDACVPLVLTQHHLVDLLPATDAQVFCLDSARQLWSGQNQHNPLSEVRPENLAYVIYTSGSTGKPKGVMIEHRSLVNFTAAETEKWGIHSSDRVLQFGSLSFDVVSKDLYPCWSVGGTVVLRTQEMLNSISTFVQKCWEWKLTVMNLTTAFWHQLMTELARTHESLPPSLRLVFIGGERVLPEKVKLWQEYVRDMLHSLKLVEAPQLLNAYGPTETTVVAMFFDLSNYIPENTQSSIPIGRPIANTQTYILDTELQPVPIGVRGELYIGGAGLARGYLNRPDLTTEKFIQNPFNTSQRLYKTGDYGRYLPDGNIEFLGRIDNQVKIRGFRMELGEIEAVLEQHPMIGQAVAIAKEDKLGDKRLIAYVVPNLVSCEQMQQEVISSLRGFLQGKLPEYMLPTAFGVLKEFPLTPNDKVDRQALAQLPTDSYLLSEKTYIAPRTLEEEMLARLWAEVLDIERVGVNDNFFSLGGDSLKTIVLLNRLQEQLGTTCQMLDLFNAPTIAELAVSLSEKSSSLDKRIATNPNIKIDNFPLSFIQERFWFYQKLNLNVSYNIPYSFRLTGQLDVAILQKSFNEIIRRHSILRTTLQEVNGSLMQVVASIATVNMSVVELHLPEPEQLKEVERLTEEELLIPVSLDKDPWLRVKLIRLAEESHIVLICLHHLLVDNESLDILLKELVVLYEAFASGKPSPLPQLPLQYGDYAQWQRQSLTPEVLQTRLNYWQRWLSKEPAVLALPTDRPLPATQTFRGGTFEYQLSPELTEELKVLSQLCQVSLFTTILTAFVTFLYCYSSTEDIVLGIPVTGRDDRNLKTLIGHFGRILALRIDLGGNPSFTELLTRVRQQMLEAMANQDVPFEHLAKTLQPQSQRKKPFFRVIMDFLLEPMPKHLELPDLTVTSLPQKKLIMRPDLNLFIWEKNTSNGTVVEGRWQYKKDLFDADTIARMAKNFEALLATVVAHPEQLVNSPILTHLKLNNADSTENI